MAGGLSSIYYSLTAKELMLMGLDVIEVRSTIYSSQNLHNIYVLNLHHEEVIQRPIIIRQQDSAVVDTVLSSWYQIGGAVGIRPAGLGRLELCCTGKVAARPRAAPVPPRRFRTN